MYTKNIKEIKNSLRAQNRCFRENLSSEQKLRFDSAILSRLMGLREYAAASTVFVYVSKSIEVDTLGFLQKTFLSEKRVAVPRCIPGTFEMEFYYIQSMGDLGKGTFGVLEPVPEKCKLVTDYSKGLCVVPGLSFDLHGFRLGYGKGYYDRFLSGFGGVTVGICYSDCVGITLPHGYYDRPVDILVTEKYIRNIQKTTGEGTAQSRGQEET